MSASTDGAVVVLGAGIVGVSVALHLRRRGRRVLLLDKRSPGEETSYGNAGVIEGGNYVPIAFPLNPFTLARYGMKRETALNFHWGFLPRIAPWLASLARNSTPAAIRRNGDAINTLLDSAIESHRDLLGEGGRAHLLRENGWLHLFRSERSFSAARHELDLAEERGFPSRLLTVEETQELEPSLQGNFARGVFWPGHASVSDPGAVTRNAFELFIGSGGEFRQAHVRGLRRSGDGWQVELSEDSISAQEVVVALGPWSMDLLSSLGLRFPFAVKRGYHQHYLPVGNAALARPVLDVDNGFVLTPMAKGYRITTGIEFGHRDAKPTPVQLAKARAKAGELFPLGEAVEDEPWLGRRPCLPDSKPVLGRAPGHEGLWLSFGHAHLGFTLGPVCGRLMAQMMCGEPPLADPAPFSPARFRAAGASR